MYPQANATLSCFTNTNLIPTDPYLQSLHATQRPPAIIRNVHRIATECLVNSECKTESAVKQREKSTERAIWLLGSGCSTNRSALAISEQLAPHRVFANEARGFLANLVDGDVAELGALPQLEKFGRPDPMRDSHPAVASEAYSPQSLTFHHVLQH